ncbi:D-amino acid dehydrogenase [Roseiarcaceae bacterium H3SJ34-1]|nr:D-amino acid dehydrogenase [Roseiarcaceae bacterium H3SJ34-1]
MKVLVLGAGVIGVTTAYYLARAGHEVTVIDRQSSAGLETSFANAGEISPGYASPWAGPGVPLKAFKWLTMKNGPLVIHPKADPAMWRWMFQMLRNCNKTSYRINKSRMVRLAEYSRDCLRALRHDIGLAYDERQQGTLQLFRQSKQLENAAADIAILKEFGVPFEMLDPAGCVAAEPALALVRGKIAGGLRLPGDETGDCYMFTQKLAGICESLGVRFLHNVTIEKLVVGDTKLNHVVTTSGLLSADAVVVACGSYSTSLMKDIGVSLPVYPVKGYSITLPIADPAAAPVSTVMDETYKIAITRLGDRIRVGGTAELSGFNLELNSARRRTLEHSVSDLFPGAGDLARSTFWTGLRPMTPDGTPVIGPTSIRNLYLNTGHGTLGWTMACGAGRLLSDMLNGAPPEIDATDYALRRYL